MDVRIIPTNPDRFSEEFRDSSAFYDAIYKHPALVSPCQMHYIYRAMYAFGELAVAARACGRARLWR